MKTFEIFSNGRTVQFTTKSVTIDGKEYPYSHISELRHSEAKRIYGFKCDDDVVMLPYEEKDTQALKLIFSRVQQMHRQPAPAKAVQPAAEPVAQVPAAEPIVEATVVEPAAEVPAEAPVAESAAEVPAEAPVAEPAAEVPAEAPVAETIAEVPVEEPPAEVPVAEPVTEAPIEDSDAEVPAGEVPTAEIPAETPALSEKELRKERKRKEKEQRKADKEAAKREEQAQKAGGSVTYTDTESGSQTVPPETPGRFKKAIIIFIIVLAVFALLGVAYYFFIGPASDPQIGPNATDQTQYNDIDDMINDLEN